MKTKILVRLTLSAIALGLLTVGVQAATVDLTTGPTAAGWAGGAYFSNVDPSGSQGTGVFEPFMRLQGSGQTPAGGERGYNTDGTLEFDTKAGAWTHSVQFSDMDFFSCSDFASGDASCDVAQKYYLFVLDYNQTKASPLLSIDDIEIYESDNASLTGYNAGVDWANKLFDLGANNVLLDYSISSTGSGGGDLFAFIPLATNTKPQMVFYNKNGATSGYDWNDGFEEWAFVVGPGCQGGPNCDGDTPDVPEPSSMLLMGGGLLGLALWRKRKNS